VIEFPPLGFGVGLRRAHYAHIVEQHTPLDWFEVISENFMVAGGRPLEVLDRVRADYPVVLHGVSLSIGSADPLDRDYLRQLSRLAHRTKPAMVSDHLCWTGVGGHTLHDLIPLPCTQQAVSHVVERIRTVQEILEQHILIENISSYLEFSCSTLKEWEFLTTIAEQADCGILLDINNVYVNAFNHRFDPRVYIDALPSERIAQFHLAGHSDCGNYLLDTHDHPVHPEVWSLYEYAVRRFGEVSTLIEWDDNIPEFADLAEVAAEARRRCASAITAKTQCAATRPRDGAQVWRYEVRSALRHLQESFYGAVVSTSAEHTPLTATAICREVKGDERLAPSARIAIYSNAYFSRLLDCLSEDFPAAKMAVGESAFEEVARAYLTQYPPTEPSIAYAGRYFADFLPRHTVSISRPFVAELAGLERALIEAFHAADAPPLKADEMRAIAPAEWSAFNVRTHPTVQVLDCRWRVHDVLSAIKEGRGYSEPARETCSLLVWRKSAQVYYRELQPTERAALAVASTGAALASIFEAFAAHLEDENAPAEINRALSKWLVDGLLTRS
jgi:uncharacterized protein (UPF0276 family)